LLSPEHRQHFVLLARENRTNVRQSFTKVVKREGGDNCGDFSNPMPQTPMQPENQQMAMGALFKVPSTPNEAMGPNQMPHSAPVVMQNPYVYFWFLPHEK